MRDKMRPLPPPPTLGPVDGLRRNLLGALCLAGWVPTAAAVEVGQTAPDIDLSGVAPGFALSTLRGRHVYVDFWASWCGPCRQSFPWLAALQARYRPEQLTVLAINLDKHRTDADRFLARYPAPFPVVYDPQGDTARRYGVKAMPSSYLLAPDGRVLHAHRGFTLEDAGRLDKRIDALINQRVADTVPPGTQRTAL